MPKLLSTVGLVLAALGVAAIFFIGDADAANCLAGAKSKNSNTPVTVTFVNSSGEFRSVMWADFSGKLKNYANLNPGQSYTVNTFTTHPWIFTDGPGNCVEMFVARAGTHKYTLKAKLIGSGGD
jgi:hypothetical protein